MVKKFFVDEVEATFHCGELSDTIFDYGYRMDRIFNVDETGLNPLPSSTQLVQF